MVIRKADAGDIQTLTDLREKYLREGRESANPEEAGKLRETLTAYFEKHISQGDFLAVLAEEDGEPVSTAFLSVAERPPRSAGFCRAGTVYNVYTLPEYRRRGIAEQVMQRLLEEAKQLDLSGIDLMASGQGLPLYLKLGFREAQHTAMRLPSDK